MADKFEMAFLLDFYGEVLAAPQREAMDMFYNTDLSLSEIAGLTGITRQGVHDRIVKGEQIITELESKLGLAERFSGMKREIDGIVERLAELQRQTGVDTTALIADIRRLGR